MSFLQDKCTRLFFLGILFLLLLLFLGNIVQAEKQKEETAALLIRQNETIASSLLEQGVSERVIADALRNETITEQGGRLLRKLRVSETTDANILPASGNFRYKMGGRVIMPALIFSVLLLALLFAFFSKREVLYQTAIRTVAQYTKGDFSIRLPELKNGTLYQLFTQVNTMAVTLKSRQEAENKAKEFLRDTVSDISHQLKTPLAALVMYHEIIREEPEHMETVINFIQKSQLAVSRMEHLIKSLLKITRLDAGSISFHKNSHPVQALILQSIAELTDRAEYENKAITISGDGNAAISCDLEWTREAIGNIVKNALDHTERGGEITISWEQTPVMLRITIADNGTGISDEDLYHIFKRFYRSKNSLDTQGIGLGLSLAKSIVEGQNGTITVESAKDRGTAFLLSFPAQLTKL